LVQATRALAAVLFSWAASSDMKRLAPVDDTSPSSVKKLHEEIVDGSVKRVWCVRHGQAEHNVAVSEEIAKFRAEGREWSLGKSEALGIRDPPLTEFGRQQARIAGTDSLICDTALAASGSPERAQLIVVSPLRRTLQTALGLCRGTPDSDFKLLAHPDIQECMQVPSDTGRPLQDLQQEFGSDIDFSMLEQSPDTWFEKPSPMTKDDLPDPDGQAALAARCSRFTEWLAARPEDRIIVVAHHTLFSHLLSIDFLNCEVIEMALHVQPRGKKAAWKVAKATGDVVPLYLADGKEVSFCGSPALSGTLAACLTKHGMDAAQLTAKRAALPDPAVTPPVGPAAPAST